MRNPMLSNHAESVKPGRYVGYVGGLPVFVLDGQTEADVLESLYQQMRPRTLKARWTKGCLVADVDGHRIVISKLPLQ